MPEENQLSQEEIEQLLRQAGLKGTAETDAPVEATHPAGSRGATPAASSSESPSSVSASNRGTILDPKEIEALFPGAGAGKSASSKPPPLSGAGDDAERVLSQEEIERLLAQVGRTAPPAKSPPAAAEQHPKAEPQAPEQEIAPADVEYLLHQAQQALASIDAPAQSPPPGATAFRLEEFTGAPASTEVATLDLIRDVELDLRIELGRTHMYLEDVLRLRRGSVVPLDKLAGDPVDIYVNDRLIARGEVLVLNDNFCVRVAELLAGTGPESK
ncbi:MAG: flagellar motor switch protein FliN [Thermoguttaceae bacterium]|nr:flagellar motor switch protein FliN [Thermoguttaceae bacterium]MDW8037273.1 flagellar motor switch protein FliN [Thermoguttaceae bacterium]